MAKKKLFSGKMTVFAGGTLILVTAVMAVLFLFYLNGSYAKNYVAKVNGESIERNEFLRQLKLERTNTLEYFNDKYNADPSEDFWNKDFGGEVPITYAREMALKECVKIKVSQILAKENGLIDDISDKAFLKELSTENKRRKKSIDKKQPVYGPVEYDENTYFTQVLSKLVIQTKDKLFDEELKPTEAELKSYYEQVKDKLYKKEDYISFYVLSIYYGKDGGGFTEEDRNAAFDRMIEIKAQLDQGESFDDVAKVDPKKIKIEEKTLDADSASYYSKAEPKLYDVIKMIKIGQLSNVLDESMQRKVEIVTVVQKKDSGYKSFDEYKDAILSGYMDEKYNELINKLVQEASVIINESVLDKTYPD